MATILIVDDAKFMRTLVKDALVPRGHEVIGEAENGNQAVELYRKLKPDLVTMDITMRERTGYRPPRRYCPAIPPRASSW
jgi:two-component system chemotaxis response regulator CheY